MSLDIRKYRRHVDGFDLTEEQKDDLIRTVWAILESFVDRAFGPYSVQQDCGQFSPNSMTPKGITIDSNDTLIDNEQRAASALNVKEQ